MHEHEKEQLIRELAHIGLRKLRTMNSNRRWRLEVAMNQLKEREKLATEAHEILGDPPQQFDRIVRIE